ncbi:hypothetical protein JZ751_011225 [Albula glossodonta]|uniref:Uncharacterized protein n=1 Tax=Albula glossodonta TaxID=121402 RepID=A0A8T2NWN4_9TELE|nr:hypothetical protein JZ751_011225 [Albula glossodonta]
MAQSASALEEELSCPVCLHLFRDPVSLTCQHSFCRGCLEKTWRQKPGRECPVCRRKSSLRHGVPNLKLRNIVEAYGQDKGVHRHVGWSGACKEHRVEARLFCEDCEGLVCTSCLNSEKHSQHTQQPVDEAIAMYKDKLLSQLQALHKKRDTLNQEQAASSDTTEHIRSQAQRVSRQIKAEFEMLHRFLREEERTRLAALKEEEERKAMLVGKRVDQIMSQIVSLTETISGIEHMTETEDSSFLEGYKSIKERVQSVQLDPGPVSGALIDVAKHLGSLRFRIWEKMLEVVQYELHQRLSTMDFRMSSLDDDLCCPVCCDTYSDPVVLRCSHSFCRFCLDAFWKTMPTKECPVCRRKSSTDNPPANLALRNIVETFLKERRENPEEGTSGHEASVTGHATRGQEGSAGSRCSQHGERLLLYCIIDHEAICMECQTSGKHQNHQLCSINEAAFDLKEEMKTCLGPMKEKLEAFDKAKQECVKTAQHIQAYRDIKGRTSNTLQHPETVSGSLINVAKHLGSLKFRVWEKMLGTVKYNSIKGGCKACPLQSEIPSEPPFTISCFYLIVTMIKAWLVLVLLLPLCAADYEIECYGEDFLMVRNQRLQCRSKVPQACYTRAHGEKGCTVLKQCDMAGWKCCHKNLCNA